MRGNQRLTADEAVALVLAGLKGEATVEELCWRHRIADRLLQAQERLPADRGGG